MSLEKKNFDLIVRRDGGFIQVRRYLIISSMIVMDDLSSRFKSNPRPFLTEAFP